MREMRGQFLKVFRTRGGLKFNGELSDPIERTTPSDFRPRRFLTVSKLAEVNTGDVVSGNDTQFLIALASTFSQTKQFKCFEITHKISWTRTETVVDPVTGVNRDSHQVVLDPALPVIIEYGTIDKPMGIEAEKYKILTGADVKVGDRLGAWLVHTRREAFGLKLLEVT